MKDMLRWLFVRPLQYKVFCGKKRVFSIFNEEGTSIRYHKILGQNRLS